MKKNIIVLGLILALVGIIFFLDLPVYNNLALVKEEIKTLELLAEEKEETIIKVNQLKEVYEEHSSEIKKAYYALPAEPAVPNLIVQLEALASENGLVLENFSYQEKQFDKSKEETRKPYKTLTINLELHGSYLSFISFLEVLEYNIRIMDVQNVEFSPEETGMEGQEEQTSEFFSFNIELDVYYQ